MNNKYDLSMHIVEANCRKFYDKNKVDMTKKIELCINNDRILCDALQNIVR